MSSLHGNVGVHPFSKVANIGEHTGILGLAAGNHAPRDNTCEVEFAVLVRTNKRAAAVAGAGADAPLVLTPAHHTCIYIVDAAIVFLALFPTHDRKLDILQFAGHAGKVAVGGGAPTGVDTHRPGFRFFPHVGHSHGLDVLVEGERLRQLQDRDVIGDDAAVVVLMSPHFRNLYFLMVGFKRILDVMSTSNDLKMTRFPAVNAVGRTRHVVLVHNCGAASVVERRDNEVVVLQRNLPRIGMWFSLLSADNSLLESNPGKAILGQA